MMAEAIQLGFDYEALEPAKRDRMRARAERIHRKSRRAAVDIVHIGQDLTEAKADLGHGGFSDWIEEEFAWTDRTARRYMRVYELFKSDNLSDLETLKIDVSALWLIAEPRVPKPISTELIALAESGLEITHRIAVVELAKRGVKQNKKSKKPTKKHLPYSKTPVLSKDEEFDRDMRIAAPVAEAVDTLAHCMEPPARMWSGLARIHADSFLQNLEDAIQYLARLQRERPNAVKRPSIVALPS